MVTALSYLSNFEITIENQINSYMKKETYLTFVLGEELFAVNVNNVLEVLEQQRITRVPNAPGHVLGIINFRGEIVPVINTRFKFKLDTTDKEKNYIIIFIIGTGESQYSISAIADGVRDVIEISPDEIKPVPDMGINYKSGYLAGVIKRNDEFILLIQPEKVFSHSEAEIAKQKESSDI